MEILKVVTKTLLQPGDRRSRSRSPLRPQPFFGTAPAATSARTRRPEKGQAYASAPLQMEEGAGLGARRVTCSPKQFSHVVPLDFRAPTHRSDTRSGGMICRKGKSSKVKTNTEIVMPLARSTRAHAHGRTSSSLIAHTRAAITTTMITTTRGGPPRTRSRRDGRRRSVDCQTTRRRRCTRGGRREAPRRPRRGRRRTRASSRWPTCETRRASSSTSSRACTAAAPSWSGCTHGWATS